MTGIAPQASESLSRSTLIDIDDLGSGVDARLSSILREQQETLSSISTDGTLLVDAWTTLLSGGKRLRAAFAYWGFRAVDPSSALTPETTQALFRIGASLELFQAAALFHDDVMDRSDTRRGNPTAHKSFESAHLTGSFVGDATQYGISTAILLGDLSLVASESEFREASYSFDEGNRLRAHKEFDQMRSTVTVGQFLDIHAQVAPWPQDLSATKTRAFDVIRTKTASYSVKHPLLAGAALAGATTEQMQKLELFATPVGIAYQLFDDLLGAFGDSAKTGKPTGDDLREGKRTVLVIEALERLEADDRSRLQDALGRAELSDSEVTSLLELISQSGAVEATQLMVENLAEEGLAHLNDASFNPVGVKMLQELTAFTLNRSY